MTRITGKTVDTELDQDVISFVVGGTEQGRITTDGSSLGGGFEVGSSFLEATSPDILAFSGGAAFIPLVLDESAGSDLSINAVSSTRIDVATTGWYSLRFQYEAVGSASVSNQHEQDIYVNGVIKWTWYMQLAPVPAAVGNNLVIPAYEFTAGDYVEFRVVENVFGGGTTDLDLMQVQVVRLA